MKYFIQNIKVLPLSLVAPVVLGSMILVSQSTFGQQKKASGKGATTVVVPKTHSSFNTEIEGVVLDAITKKPVLGARVFYKDLASSIAKEDGTFKIKLPNSKVILSVEAPGFKSYEVAVAGRKSIQLVMQAFDGIENTSVMPTGVVSEYYRTDAASSLSLPDSWTAITESPDTYLQGRVAGLNVTRHSGTQNSGAFMALRGLNSLQGTNKPLIVVDGVIYDASIYGISTINNYFENPLSYIDPRDISDITVLKDASAATLYGTKGANGVILITTSRAKELGTKIDFALYGGMNLAPSNLPVMNAANYRTYLNDLMVSQGLSNTQIQAMDFMNDNKATNSNYFNTHNETDWQKKIFSANPLKNMYLRITGGDNIAKYALSMNYLGSKNSLSGSGTEKYSTRFNADLNLSRRLTGAANLSFSYNEADAKDGSLALKTNPMYLALVKAPFLSDYERNTEGVTSPRFTDSDPFNIGNPVVAAQNTKGANRAYRFQGIIDFKYKLSSIFDLGTNLAITFDKITENHFTPDYGLVPDTLKNVLASKQASAQAKKIFNLYNETYLSFNKNYNHLHDLSGRTGLRFIRSVSEQDVLYSYNAAIDEITSVQNTSPLYNNILGGNGSYNWLNTYLNLNYAYAGKYFVSFNAALDGSSRFGKSIESSETVKIGSSSFALMPSITAAWVVSSEKFMANKGLDLLKLRISTGRVGNDDIGNYNFQKYYTAQSLLGNQGIVQSSVANPALKWETVNKFNVGVDLVTFKQRLSLTVDLFNNKTTDMLVMSNAPTTSGLNYLLTNEGAMSTSGVDATLNVKLISKANFSWDLGATIAKASTKVAQLPSAYANSVSPYNGASYLTSVGQAPNLFYGAVAQGVYASDADATQAGLTTLQANGTYKAFKGGDVRFVDVNGDKVIDDKDNQIIGNPNPNFYGGISNRLTYKNWSLDALVSFVSGNDVYNYTRRRLESGSGYENQSNALVGRWRGQGQIADIPRVTYGDPVQNSRFSSRWIEDGSYARLRTVTLAYNFNLNKDFLRYVTVYVTGNNLVTLTKYLGYDPEFSATNTAIGQGVDNMLEPIQKSFYLGIKFGL